MEVLVVGEHQLVHIFQGTSLLKFAIPSLEFPMGENNLRL